jgi:CHAT domain-containing protein/Tfp pilus assembly protein PilF
VAIREAITAGRFAEAESLARRRLTITEKTSGPDAVEVADALDLLVEVLWRAGKAIQPRSEELAERAVRLHERIEGPDGVGLAQSMTNLAWINFHCGDYAGARSRFERALLIREKILGPVHPEVASSLRNLAVVLAESGLYAEARPLFERALAIRESSLGSNHPAVTSSLNDLGILLRYMGDDTGARRVMERALGLREEIYGRDHHYVASSLTNLGLLLSEAGEFSAAKAHYDRALGILERDYGPDHFEVAGIVEGLAELFAKVGDYDGARKNLERSLAIRQKARGTLHPEVAASLANLGILLSRLGESARAESLLERARIIRVKTLGPGHPDVAEDLLQLAVLKASRGDSVVAFEDALLAEQITREHVRLTCRTLPESQALRYAAARGSGLDLAISLCVGGLGSGSIGRAWDELIRSRALVLDEMVGRHRSWGASGDTATLRLVNELSAANQRIAKLTIRGLGPAGPEEYAEQLETARKEKERAERALAEQSASFRVAQARSQMDLSRVATALGPGDALVAFAQYQQYALANERGSTGTRGIQTASTRRLAGEQAPMSSYVAFVLRGGEAQPELLRMGSAESVDSVVAHWSDSVVRSGGTSAAGGRDEARYRTIASVLRQAVWDPIAKRVAGMRRVFLVPDGSLHLVSFASLPTEDGSYLVEQAPTIHYLSTERDLIREATTTEYGSGLLVLGDPDFDRSERPADGAPAPGANFAAAIPMDGRKRSSCEGFQTLHFSRLRAAAHEVEDVARLWRASGGRGRGAAVIKMTGANASKAAFMTAASGRRVLHLATHGFFLGGRCRSALQASRGIVLLEPDDAGPPVGDNPLLLSGLAFAGANHRDAARPEEDDGILTAEEIATLDLSGVEWAVLSGCDTGVGEVRAGEGVIGLRRAFELAGARTLIMSLWSVDDEATRRWMRALYEARLQRGLPTTEAVREASLSVLRDHRARGLSTHPFFWAPFVAAGNWR